MKERLTKHEYGNVISVNGKIFYDYPIADVIERLAEYEDLEEQGLLVRLPCKAGDEVVISKAEYEKLKSFVHEEDVYRIMKEELSKNIEAITKELWTKVRKETAKEIFKNLIEAERKDGFNTFIFEKSVFYELAKQYGVEVEE